LLSEPIRMAHDGDVVAQLVLDAYDRLPQKCKPFDRGPGSREWVPLSGIVLEDGNGDLECVALGCVDFVSASVR
jgi:tRNA-specific adenosine deaminase 1